MKVFMKLYEVIVFNRPLTRDEQGQATAEYALVIVGAAIIAGLLIAWASGSGAIQNLFQTVISKVMGKM